MPGWCPVRMDDGRIQVFTGYRCQHNNALGPFKGGIRFDAAVHMDEVMALAMETTMFVAQTSGSATPDDAEDPDAAAARPVTADEIWDFISYGITRE